jgi:hypothetical protein
VSAAVSLSVSPNPPTEQQKPPSPHSMVKSTSARARGWLALFVLVVHLVWVDPTEQTVSCAGASGSAAAALGCGCGCTPDGETREHDADTVVADGKACSPVVQPLEELHLSSSAHCRRYVHPHVYATLSSSRREALQRACHFERVCYHVSSRRWHFFAPARQSASFSESAAGREVYEAGMENGESMHALLPAEALRVQVAGYREAPELSFEVHRGTTSSAVPPLARAQLELHPSEVRWHTTPAVLLGKRMCEECRCACVLLCLRVCLFCLCVCRS